ncbi:hypothetical protein GCM10029964_067990 [Kibdelosporangium lantanae]
MTAQPRQKTIEPAIIRPGGESAAGKSALTNWIAADTAPKAANRFPANVRPNKRDNRPGISIIARSGVPGSGIVLLDGGAAVHGRHGWRVSA